MSCFVKVGEREMKNEIKKLFKKRNETIDKKVEITKKIKEKIKENINKQKKILGIDVFWGVYGTTIFVKPYINNRDLEGIKKDMENLGLKLISIYVPMKGHSILDRINGDSCIGLTFSEKS